jgi:hypothetical protein
LLTNPESEASKDAKARSVDPLLEDFVNREAALKAMWKAVREETDQRILLIRGPDGIGKTYLLEEFRAECEAQDLACLCLDFAETPATQQSHLTFALKAYEQLGPEGFETLVQTIRDTRSLGAWETVQSPPPVVAGLGRPDPAQTLPKGRSGGVDFHQPVTIHGDVVGRDAYYLQLFQRDDPAVQQLIKSRITAALRDCLGKFANTRTLVLLLNSWHQTTTEMRNWLSHNPLYWIAAKELSLAVAVVAGEEVPDLQRLPRRIGRVILRGLPNDAVHVYWIEKRGLPPEDVPNIITYSRGLPMLLAMIADQREIALEVLG